jgi:hypothetical protein
MERGRETYERIAEENAQPILPGERSVPGGGSARVCPNHKNLRVNPKRIYYGRILLLVKEYVRGSPQDLSNAAGQVF